MSEFVVRILNVENIAGNIIKIITERPEAYNFIPGQSTSISFYTPPLNEIKRSYSFTGLSEAPILEFFIKKFRTGDAYDKNSDFVPGNKLLIGEAEGNIRYKGTGIFLAGGTGVIPFISIFRNLRTKKNIAGNMLIVSNKTKDRIILYDELTQMLGSDFIKIFTGKRYDNFYYGRIDINFLRMIIIDTARYFYICGPDGFVRDIKNLLRDLGVAADSIISEEIAVISSLASREIIKAAS